MRSLTATIIFAAVMCCFLNEANAFIVKPIIPFFASHNKNILLRWVGGAIGGPQFSESFGKFGPPEKVTTKKWETYMPSIQERILCVYYTFLRTIVGSLLRLPVDARELFHRSPLLFPLLLTLGTLHVPVRNSAFGLAVTLLLLPALLRLGKGIFYTFGAAYAVSYTWDMKMTYVHQSLPWWIENKLSDAHNSGGNVEFLVNLCSNPDIHAALRGHIKSRTLVPGSIPDDDYLTQLSDWSGSYVNQLYLFGSDHVRQHMIMHKTVSCVAHILDDYDDQEEDRTNGQFNYFNDHPLAEDMPVTYWIQRMQDARDYFVSIGDPAMVRLIDGSCGTTTLFHPQLYELVYKNEDFDFGNPWGRLPELIFKIQSMLNFGNEGRSN